ncbi:hypothetical protein CBS101457_004904 [Exobasidium rhododendri]|nr:hypothetical protein CBS101457_004904 [Exobasidium rhododendri]
MSLNSNGFAHALKVLHQRRNKPLILANVYDTLSASIVAELRDCEALATASYAIARAAGMSDDDLTLKVNFSAIRAIAKVAAKFDKPLTVDIQDGYGSQLEEAMNDILDLGVAGINLEDADKSTGELYTIDDAVDRITRAIGVAQSRDVPDFVVNARCDVLAKGGELDEVLKRGTRYLAAGATTIFVWGGQKNLSKAEITTLVGAFQGRLNVMLDINGTGPNVRELSEIGVARISIGPALQTSAMNAVKEQAQRIMSRE